MNELTSDDILGKQAIGPDGKILGTIIKLHISNRDKQITGITIDEGFMKPDLFVGISFIRNFGIDAVFLNRSPHDGIKGLKVLTNEGQIIGIIKDVVLEKGHLRQLVVQTKSGLINREQVSIPASSIHVIGGSVILKKDVKL